MTAADTGPMPDQSTKTAQAESLTERLVQLAQRLDEELGQFHDVLRTIEQRVDHLIGEPTTTDRLSGDPVQTPDSPLLVVAQGISRLATYRQQLEYYAARL